LTRLVVFPETHAGTRWNGNSAINLVTHETCCRTSQGGTSYGQSSSNRTQHRLRKKVKKKYCCSLASLISCPRLTRSSGSFKVSFHDLRAARTYYFTEKTKLCAAVGSSVFTIFFCTSCTKLVLLAIWTKLGSGERHASTTVHMNWEKQKPERKGEAVKPGSEYFRKEHDLVV
jgi:hypothetical protein